jgi:actin-related protein 8
VCAPRFQDYNDMLEDTWQTSDSLYPSGNGGYGMWDNYPMFPTRLKKFDNIGLVEAIVSSVLSKRNIFHSFLIYPLPERKLF